MTETVNITRKRTGTKIEWTHRRREDGTYTPGYTFNPWWGCQRVSPGCEHCYAEAFALRTGHRIWGPTAPRRFFGEAHWGEPLKWNERARKLGEQHLVFCASMADWAEVPRDLQLLAALTQERVKLFELVEKTRNLTWLMLTKRPENIMEVTPAHWRGGFPDNVWVLTTAENQEYLDKRAPELLKVPAAVHGLSVEPMLGRVDMRRYLRKPGTRCAASEASGLHGVNWVIFGGESGASPRKCVVPYVAEGVEQCAEYGVAAFVKQLGRYPLVDAGDLLGEFLRPLKLRDPKGGDWDEWPENLRRLRVREFPTGA